MIKKIKIILFHVFFMLFVGYGLEANALDASLKRVIDLTYNAEFSQAENTVNSFITANPNDVQGYIVRSIYYDWKQLVLDLHGALDNKALEDLKVANSHAFLIWEKDPDNIDKMINLGNSYMFLAKKWLDLDKKSRSGLILKKSKKHMEEAIAKDPNRYDAYLALGIFNFYTANIPPGLKFLASILGMNGNEAKGLQLLNAAADHENIHQADALFVLTHAYGQTKQNYQKALYYLDKLRAKYPNNPHFLFLKGEYAMRAKEYDKSRQHFVEFDQFCASRSCAKNYEFLKNYFIAYGYAQEKNYMAAKPHVLKAEELNMDRFKDRTGYIHYLKGMVLKSDGQSNEAKSEFEKCLAKAGGNEVAKKLAREELAQLK